MSTHIVERTVLFADLRGSTALYEALGNSRATGLVTQSVGLMGQVVKAWKGTVVKTLGDGLMAVFESPMAGLAAAQDMHDAVSRLGAVPTQTSNGLPVAPLRLQVALTHGEVVEMAGDCFGDAVNVAARLLDHAGDNETLITAALVEQLPIAEHSRLRSLDRVRLRGRIEPVHVFLLEAEDFGDTASTAYGEMFPQPEPDGISLLWNDTSRIFSAKALPVVLGRSADLTFFVNDTRVSRTHARIDWNGTSFVITDLSYNGTFVRFDSSQEVVNLRRTGCTLHGRGLIGLAASPDDPSAALVSFEVLRFSETQPQTPD
jgi:adenylate cyclase